MMQIFLAGGPVMWPLLLCSCASLVVIIERALFWAQYNLIGDRSTIENLLEECRNGDQNWKPSSRGENPAQPSITMRMLRSGFAHKDFSCTKAMESVALEEIKKMRRGMSVLDTIITVAPMLGILGTVTGIISSFDMLGNVGVEDPKAVVSGIAEALITTAAGLVISISTVFPFNYYNSRIANAQDVLEHYGTRLEMLLEKKAGPSCG